MSLWLPALAVAVWAAVWGITGSLPPQVIDGVSTDQIRTVHIQLLHECGTGRAYVGGTLAEINGRAVSSVPVRVVGLHCSHVVPAFSVIDVAVTAHESAAGERDSYVLFPRNDAGEPVIVRPAPAVMAWAADIRASLREICARLPGYGGELIPGLAVGDTGLISEHLDGAMKTSSLTHLMAVSGANCAIVVGLVYGLTAMMGCRRWMRVGMSLVALILFVVIVTPEPSVVRASIMATIALCALARGIPVAGLSALAGAVILSLALDPWLAREYGFVLSVVATAALLTLSAPIARVLGRWIPESLATLIALPIAAQIACQPIIILLSPTIPLYGIIANVLAAPAAPIVTIVGLCAALFGGVPLVGELLAGMAWLPAWWIGGVATVVSSLPLASLPWPAGIVGFVLAACATAGIVAAVVRFRTIGIVSAATATVVALSLSLGVPMVTRWTMPRQWSLAQCDVGQGDAIVIRDEMHTAVIDTGREPALLDECLTALGINEIDLLVLTHFDVDHAGGASALVGRVRTVVHGPYSDPVDAKIVRELAGGGASVTQVWAGDQLRLGRLDITVVWPARNIPVEPGNPASVTLAVSDAGCPDVCLSSLMLGDLPADEQRRMMRLYPPARVDVVKVSHHGSRDNLPELYAAVRAQLALIGVGSDNGYGHPTTDALDMVRAAGSTIVRSDLSGLVVLSRNSSGGMDVWAERRTEG